MEQKHLHLIVTGYLDKSPEISYISTLNDWFARLVDRIGMKVLIEPRSVWCDTKGNEGVTGIVGIDTSHSSIHFWPTFYTFDLYSCKDFDENDVFEMLKEFGTKGIDYTLIERKIGLGNVIIKNGYIEL